MKVDCEVLIVGGGVPGLACAALLGDALRTSGAGRAWRVRVLEAGLAPSAALDPGSSLRVVALAPAVQRTLAGLGVWQRLPAGALQPMERMQIWQADSAPFGPRSIGFDAATTGGPALGWIVDHDVLRAELWHTVESGSRDRSIELSAGVKPERLSVGNDHVDVDLADGTRITTRLLIGADGAASWVRTALRVETSGRDYPQRAVVAHLASREPHRSTAWQCFRRTGPVALLPLADGRSSLVWSCATEQAAELLDLEPGEFGALVTDAIGGVLGALELTTPRAAFPLAARHVRQYTGARFALLGDAAHQVHPLAGQGLNLGLLDAAALASELAAHWRRFALADPGDATLLRRYERQRKGPNLLALATMDGLHRAFTSDRDAVVALAAAGLGLVDRLPPLKRLFAAQAGGMLRG